MYQGRHCSYNDYQLFEKISNEFLLLINRDNFDSYELDNYLSTLGDFDLDISSKIRINLEKMKIDKERAIIKIKSLLEELKNNVLVDIREHS